MSEDSYQIRCPFCLHDHGVPKTIAVNEMLSCSGCERQFEFQNALPPARTEDSNVPESSEEVALDLDTETQADRIASLWRIGIPAVLLCTVGLSLYAHNLDGPSFLLLYLFTGLGALFMANVTRWYYVDSFNVSHLAAGFMVLMATVRFIDGMLQGMSAFAVMWIMLGFIVLALYFRIETVDGKSKSTFFGTCGGGCGSSCSGGCGGGCGGCGD